MEASVEKIIKALNGPAVASEEKGKEEQGKENQGQKKEEAGKGEENGGSEEQGSGQEPQKEKGGSQEEKPGQPKAAEPQEPWQKVAPAADSLHYQWNEYMPQAAKEGASKQLIEGFSTTLNSLTNNILNKNRTNTLLAANSLYSYIPDFYGLYKTAASPEIKRIRYYTRNSMLNSMTANWPQADSDINNLKATWNLYKASLPKEQQDNSSKLEYSIYELEKVVKEKSQPLIEIKGRVALSNVKNMDEAAQKEAEKK